MSWKRYYETYDRDPQRVIAYRPDGSVGFKATVSGPVSAEVVARTYRRKGWTVTIRPANTNTKED